MHHTNKRFPWAVGLMAGAIVALFPLAGHALGLGKMTVRSALNEPLNAEIEIDSVTDKELKGLQVGLAPRADFAQAGVEVLPFLSQIKFNVSKRADGNYFIHLRTDQQIEEPFLHILLAVEWPGGRLVREYTALIDPPVQITGRPSGIEAPQATPSNVPPVLSSAPIVEQPEPVVPAPVAKTEPQPTPPVVEPSARAAPSPTPVTPPSPVSQSTESAAPTADSKPAVESLPAPAASGPLVPSVASGWAQDGGYKVNRGATAWRIAEELRTNSAYSIEQIVLALYRANPHAFFGNNVNNLKAGQILKVPEDADIESVPAVQARSQFRAQYDAWQEYKIKLAGASSAVKVVESEPKQAAPTAPAVTEAAAAKKEPEKAAKAPAPAGQQEELLKIVRSTLQGEKTTPDKKPVEGETRKDVGTKEHQALADRVATLEESLASRQVETKELGDKVAQVRAQLKREARLIQIENKDLATQQARTKPEAAKAPEVAKPLEPAPKPEIKAEPVPAPKAGPKVEEKPAVAPPAAEAPKVEKPAPGAEKPAAVAAPKKPVAPPPTPEEKGFVAELMDSILGGDMFLPIVLGAVVLLSGGIALVYLNRRRKSIAEFEESILQSEAISGHTGEPGMTSDTSGQVVSSGDTSFLSDFSQGGMGNIHTDEVDPIAEAEVYLAYGRDETAEEILKEAIVKNPGREELKLKLLEIYANRSDTRAFETLAEEMYAAMGGRPSKNWARVEDLGRKLNPANPMFRGGGAAPATAAAVAVATPSFTETAKMKATMPPTTATIADTQTGIISPISPPAAAETEAGDFDFDLSESIPAADAEQGFDIDLGETAPKPAAAEAIDFAPSARSGKDSMGLEPAPTAASSGIDFDFGEKEESSITVPPETEIAMEAPPAEAPISEIGEAPQWDETATKLDLARAYVDMGDAEGARSILQEVMAEGNDQQKKQAKELAAQIG